VPTTARDTKKRLSTAPRYPNQNQNPNQKTTACPRSPTTPTPAARSLYWAGRKRLLYYSAAALFLDVPVPVRALRLRPTAVLSKLPLSLVLVLYTPNKKAGAKL
jgi:hypothetical protein